MTTTTRPLTFFDVAKTLVKQPFQFAKTMPDNPHSYVLRKKWIGSIPFNDIVIYIREHGYKQYWGGRPYSYLDINGYQYWTMGAPIPETILINRAKKKVKAPYDGLAAVYDEKFSDPDSIEENKTIIKAIDYQGGSVLDIGCGTGLFLDYVQPDQYLGIDPSMEMLKKLRLKHPGGVVANTDFDSFYTSEKYDHVISLFGSPSYINPENLNNIRFFLKKGGRAFLMFYAPEYEPKTHTEMGINQKFYCEHQQKIYGEVTRYKNYEIITFKGV